MFQSPEAFFPRWTFFNGIRPKQTNGCGPCYLECKANWAEPFSSSDPIVPQADRDADVARSRLPYATLRQYRVFSRGLM